MPKLKQELTDEQIRGFQDLYLAALKLKGQTETEIATQAGINQSLVNELKRGPKIGMSLISALRLFAVLDISPNKLASVLGIWEDDDSIDPAIYVRIASLSKKSEERQKTILWVLDQLLQAED